MSQFPDSKFLQSADASSQFVSDLGSEVAVAGRSNAGKSSVINVIVNRRQFARTSKTPGRTQLVNFFELRTGQRLVDLPGYGFAKVSDAVRRHWGELIHDYFQSRKSLSGLLLVVDIRRRQLTDFDWQMMNYAAVVSLPVHVLLTKTDKVKRGQASTTLVRVKEQLGEKATVQLFSALTRQGAEEARVALEDFLSTDTMIVGSN